MTTTPLFNTKHQLNTQYRQYEGNMWYNDALEYIIGEKAIYTIQNENSGNRFTFRTKVSRKNKNFLNVYVLSGSDNNRDYSLLGYINRNRWEFNLSQFSTITEDAQSFKVFKWVYNNLRNNSIPSYIKVYHHNKCCRCGRTLTTIESIQNGIGPVCINMRKFGRQGR